MKISFFTNQNSLFKKYPRVHSALVYNHYLLLVVYLAFNVIISCLANNSEIPVFLISLLFFLEVIVVRPYRKVSEKLRAIYFAFIYTMVPFVRLINNHASKDGYNASLSILLLVLLIIAILWTFSTLILHFYILATKKSSD